MENRSADQFFVDALLNWYQPSERPMPWKGETNPYFIWLSEVILQQTRVEQGKQYYLKFIQNYPTVKALAQADESKVLADWEGLGYYSRARNLHFAAKQIVDHFDGKFPETHQEILSLKGVGSYTAAAISSFAFRLPHAVVDGNVIRIISRFFGFDTPFDTTFGKKLFAEKAQSLLPFDNARYNQAIMDFGATVCAPKSPKCAICPLQTECFAAQHQMQALLPVKSKKIKKQHRYFIYLVVREKNQIAFQQRVNKDVWQNMFELPLIEVNSQKEFANYKLENSLNKYGISKQTLTHLHIHAKFLEIDAKDIKNIDQSAWQFKSAEEWHQLACPKIVRDYLNTIQNEYI